MARRRYSWTAICRAKHTDRIWGYDPSLCPGSPTCDAYLRDQDGRIEGVCGKPQKWTAEFRAVEGGKE